jgi:uncharacterized membrane protein YbhN (UPF0104 family)
MAAPAPSAAGPAAPGLSIPADEGRRLRRSIISLLLVGVIVIGLVLAVPGLQQVADRLKDVSPPWIALAVVFELLSCAGYVVAFRLIFYRSPALFAIRVALSEMAFAAVIPAGGAGGIAIGAWVVRAKGGPVRGFLERSGVLFLLTSAVNAATLVVAGVLVGAGLLSSPHHLVLGLAPAAVGLGGIALFACVPLLARRYAGRESPGRAIRWVRKTADVVRQTLEEVRHPRWRLLGAGAYLWADIAVLWISFRAFGTSLPVGALALAYLIGYLGNILPLPGGIIGLDAGLAGALILYGAKPASAAAAVLVYHAIALWVPTLLGTIAFLRLRPTLDEPIVLAPERKHP